MTGRDDQVESVVECDGPEITEDPVDVGACPSLIQHRGGRVEADKPPGVAGLPGQPEHNACAAAHVQYGFGRHDEIEVEVGVVSARVELVVKNRKARIGVIVTVFGRKHRDSVADASPVVASISSRNMRRPLTMPQPTRAMAHVRSAIPAVRRRAYQHH